jgi:hypothetical protein
MHNKCRHSPNPTGTGVGPVKTAIKQSGLNPKLPKSGPKGPKTPTKVTKKLSETPTHKYLHVTYLKD